MLYTTWYSYKEEQNFNRAKFYLKYYPNDQEDTDSYPVKFEKPENWENFLNAYVHIEKFLVHIDKADFNEMNINLYDEIYRLSEKLKRKEYFLNHEDLRQIGRIFLRLFDSLPIYSHIADTDHDSWTVLFHCKYLASIFVRQGYIHFGRTQDEIIRWRYQIKINNPEEFEKLIWN